MVSLWRVIFRILHSSFASLHAFALYLLLLHLRSLHLRRLRSYQSTLAGIASVSDVLYSLALQSRNSMPGCAEVGIEGRDDGCNLG